jgi:hypothetical protein
VRSVVGWLIVYSVARVDHSGKERGIGLMIDINWVSAGVIFLMGMSFDCIIQYLLQEPEERLNDTRHSKSR